MAVLTPESNPRETAKAIAEANNANEYDQILIGGVQYRCLLMRDEYDSNDQIGAKEGDFVVFDLVTYGYGATITWQNLCDRQQALEVWAAMASEKFHCKHEIFVSANYW
jgi:hypothetical protein